MVAIFMATKNLEESIKFYKEVLGYREETVEKDRIMLASGNENIRLEETGTFERAYPALKEEMSRSRHGVGVTISLHVQDVSQASAKIESYGGEIVKPVTGNSAGDRILICRDPDGYLLRLHSHAHTH